MDDPARVRRVERVGDLDRDLEKPLEGRRRPRQEVPKRLAFDELHDDERAPVRLVDVVDRADVRVLERRRRPGLALQSLERRGVAARSSGRNFSATRRPRRRSSAT